MRILVSLSAVLVMAAIAAGCSSSRADGAPSDAAAAAKPLSCAWASSENCWKKTLAAASDCLPPTNALGHMSLDGSTCTFASGQRVTFNPPLVPYADGSGLFRTPAEWNFSITTSGQPCLQFAQTSEGETSVATSAGTVTVSISESSDVLFTCPDASSYRASVPENSTLPSTLCDGGSSAGFPAWGGSDGQVCGFRPS